MGQKFSDAQISLTYVYAQTIQKVNVEHVENGKHAKCQT